MNQPVHTSFPPFGDSGSMLPDSQSPDVGILICGICGGLIDPRCPPSEKTLLRFCERTGRKPGGKVCPRCIKKYTVGIVRNEKHTPLTLSVLAARSAISGNRYEDYQNAYRAIGDKFNHVESEIRKRLRDIEKLTTIRNEIVRVRGDLDDALRASPNASYFLRRNEANSAIARPEIRKAVFSRDNHSCVKCGRKDMLSVDHIIPVVAGGSDDLGNLQTLCRVCNSAKGGRVAA